MKLGRVQLILAMFMALSMVLAGCSKGGTTTPATSTSAPATTSGTTRPATTGPATTTGATTTKATTSVAPTGPYGDLKIGVATFDMETFDPIIGAITDQLMFVVPVFDMLVRLDGGKLGPGVADSWEMAPDGLSWTFRLHKGIKFSNGDPLTTADVKFSFDRYMSKDAHFTIIADAVSRVDIIDDNTFKLVTKGPQPYLPTYLSFFSPAYGAIQPKNYFQKVGLDAFRDKPIGAGPWKLVKRLPGDMMGFEAVENHWRKTPAFKTLSLILAPEESTRSAMIKTGALDIADESLDGARALQQAGFKVSPLNSSQTLVLLDGNFAPESANLPTYNIKVRQALSLAINRADIQKNFLYGAGTKPLPGYLAVEAAGDADIPYWEEQAEKVYARYDVAEAKRLLTEAGYAQGFDIKIWGNIMGGGSFLPDIAKIVASYWGAIGVKTEIVPSEWGTTRPIANINDTPKSPLRGNALMMRITPRPTIAAIFQAHINPTGTIGILGKSWPEEQQIELAIGREINPAKRKEMVAQVVKKVADLYVALPIGGVPVLAALGPRVDYDFPNPTSQTMQYADFVKHR